MAGAHGVDVHVFHQHDVELHLGTCHVLSAVGAVFVAVHAADGHGHPVDAKLAGGEHGVVALVGDVLQRHVAEPHLAAYRLGGHPAGVFQPHDEGVEVGRLGGPGMYVGHTAPLALETGGPVVRLDAFLLDPHAVASGVQQLGLHGHVTSQAARQLHGQVYQSLARAFVKACHHIVVADVDARGGIDAHVAGDAAHAPHVLALEIAPVAKAHDHHCHTVLTGMHALRDVPLGRGLGVFGIAVFLAVDVEVHGRAHGAETYHHTPSAPAFGHLEVAHIAAGGIEFGGSVWGIGGELVVHIGVDGCAVALQLDVARHLYLGPFVHVVAPLVESFGAGVWVLGHAELPLAVKGAVIWRLLVAQRGHILLVGVGYHIGMRRHLANTPHPHIVPLILSVACPYPAPQ